MTNNTKCKDTEHNYTVKLESVLHPHSVMCTKCGDITY